jgi:hypothetical protein
LVINEHLAVLDQPLFRAFVAHLRVETGQLALTRADTFQEEFYWWWMSESNFSDEQHNLRLDIIEIAGAYPIQYIRENAATEPEPAYGPARGTANIMDEINARMAEDGFGFRYDRGQVIEVTSEYAHEAMITPVLGLVAGEQYGAVNQEFRDALLEFRSGHYDDCIVDCGNAFESTLKVIAGKKGWQFKTSDTASKLIALAFDNDLFPQHLQSQFTGLRSVLQGIPTVRNNQGGHGAGEQPRVVERHFAEYQINQTAAAILFLIRSAE